MHSILFVTALLSLGAQAQQLTLDDCPASLKRDEYLQVHGDSCYRFEIYTEKVYEDAESDCERDGGTLVLIKDKKTNNYLQHQLLYTYQANDILVWIGLRYNADKDRFFWLDGTYMSFRNFARSGFYKSNECVAMLPSTSKWFNYNCKGNYWSGFSKNHYICQYRAYHRTTVPPTTKEPPVITNITTDNCPANLQGDSRLKVFGDKCYYFNTEKQTTFDKAQEFCRENNGDLVMLKSTSIQHFVRHELTDTFGDYYFNVWIGLRYNFAKREYRWIDDSKLQHHNFWQSSKTKLHECAVMDPYNGAWFSDECGHEHGRKNKKNFFVCEYQSIPATTPSTPPVVTIPPNIPKEECHVRVHNDKNLQVLGNVCYVFDLTERETFDNSEKFCKKMGGTLAFAKNKAVNDFLFHHLQYSQGLFNSNESLWLGLRYDNKLGDYAWRDGTPAGYTNFKHTFQVEDCVSIVPEDGQWNEDSCGVGVKKPFICQFEPLKATTVAPTSDVAASTSISVDSSTAINPSSSMQHSSAITPSYSFTPSVVINPSVFAQISTEMNPSASSTPSVTINPSVSIQSSVVINSSTSAQRSVVINSSASAQRSVAINPSASVPTSASVKPSASV